MDLEWEEVLRLALEWHLIIFSRHETQKLTQPNLPQNCYYALKGKKVLNIPL